MVLCKTPWPVMINQINEDFGFHQKALALRQQRQEVLATNIANSDTPNYTARDIDFASALSQAMDATTRLPATQLTLTSPRHIPATAPSTRPAARSEERRVGKE